MLLKIVGSACQLASTDASKFRVLVCRLLWKMPKTLMDNLFRGTRSDEQATGIAISTTSTANENTSAVLNRLAVVVLCHSDAVYTTS